MLSACSIDKCHIADCAKIMLLVHVLCIIGRVHISPVCGIVAAIAQVHHCHDHHHSWQNVSSALVVEGNSDCLASRLVWSECNTRVGVDRLDLEGSSGGRKAAQACESIWELWRQEGQEGATPVSSCSSSLPSPSLPAFLLICTRTSQRPVVFPIIVTFLGSACTIASSSSTSTLHIQSPARGR